MQLKHYDIPHHPRKAWYGLRRNDCPAKVKEQLRRDTNKAHEIYCVSEHEFEIDCFLSILESIEKPHINLIECGAAWGEWCMALAGVFKYKLVPLTATSYYAVGIEGDFNYYAKMLHNFTFNHISGMPLYGAVADHGGTCRFNTGGISKQCCGGGMSFDGAFRGSKVLAYLLGIWHRLIRKSDMVLKMTIDDIITDYILENVDILHIDIQGSELLALQGASTALQIGHIDYIMLGTHGKKMHSKSIEMLNSRYDIVAELQPGKINYFDDYCNVWASPGQDGMLVFKRKGI